MKKFEPFIYIVLFVVFGGLVLSEGAKAAALDRSIALTPKELYRKIAKREGALQIVDVREDVEENYEDTHIPGAIPFPNCDMKDTPEGARDQVEPSVPTIIVSGDGDQELFNKCAAYFTSARNLEGGLEAWDDENLPEDSGEYQPPKVGAGGGCL